MAKIVTRCTLRRCPTRPGQQRAYVLDVMDPDYVIVIGPESEADFDAAVDGYVTVTIETESK